jgi:hypothetical protein
MLLMQLASANHLGARRMRTYAGGWGRFRSFAEVVRRESWDSRDLDWSSRLALVMWASAEDWVVRVRRTLDPRLRSNLNCDRC